MINNNFLSVFTFIDQLGINCRRSNSNRSTRCRWLRRRLCRWLCCGRRLCRWLCCDRRLCCRSLSDRSWSFRIGGNSYSNGRYSKSWYPDPAPSISRTDQHPKNCNSRVDNQKPAHRHPKKKITLLICSNIFLYVVIITLKKDLSKMEHQKYVRLSRSKFDCY